jgi:NADH-quinone oxidoreductase subunit D
MWRFRRAARLFAWRSPSCSDIAAHLIWLATHILDTSGTGMSLLMYALREREMIQDIFEMISGARLTYLLRAHRRRLARHAARLYHQGAGIHRLFPSRLDDYERMLTKSVVLRKRLEGVGVLSKEDALSLGVTGPLLRGSGVNYDLRKAAPYSGYDRYEFEVPISDRGDSYGRYLIRVQEMRQSLRIIRQALEDIKASEGPALEEQRSQGGPSPARRAGHQHGGADPSLQAGDRGAAAAGRRGLLRP